MIAFTLFVLALALIVDALFGYPGRIFRRIGHPVTWIGGLIARLDALFNRDGAPFAQRRAGGVMTLLIVLVAAIPPAAAVQYGLLAVAPKWLAGSLVALAAATLIAQRSLFDHVRAVAEGLERGLNEGRDAVSHIVGRDPESLDEAGVARAAIESLAENFSDGVVAPALWLALGGLPGIAGYKAISTADSMIGHRTPRHLAFGWASARLDDLINLPASRLAAVWIVVAALLYRGRASEAVRATIRDARKHRSPNAGWPEAAMAGALGLRLAGPRVYHGERVDDGWMGSGRADATIADIRAALRLYRTACGLQLAVVLLLAFYLTA